MHARNLPLSRKHKSGKIDLSFSLQTLDLGSPVPSKATDMFSPFALARSTVVTDGAVEAGRSGHQKTQLHDVEKG